MRANNLPSYFSLVQLKAIFSILAISLIFSAPTLAITYEVSSVSPASYGGNLKIASITISEEADNDLTVEDYKIVLYPVPGFQFLSIEDLTTPPTDGDIPNKPSTVNYSSTLEISFSINATGATDVIVLPNIILSPIDNEQTSYSGKLTLELYEGTTKKPTIYFPSDAVDDNYYMEVPVLNLSYNDVGCEGLPYTVTCAITGATETFKNISTSNNHRLLFKYFYSGEDGLDDYTEDIDITTSDQASGSFSFTITEFDNVHDKIMLRYFTVEDDASTVGIDESWSVLKYLYIEGNEDVSEEDIDIELETPVDVDFIEGPIVNAVLYEGTIPFSNYISNYYLCSYTAYSSDFLSQDALGNWSFNTTVAGSGEHDIEVVLTSGNCSTTETLTINVIPDIITADEVYCYGLNNEEVIEVAISAFDAIYRDEDSVTIEFNSIEILGNGGQLYYKTNPDNSNDDFYYFNIDPTDLLDLALKDDIHDMNIQINVMADVTTSGYELVAEIDGLTEDQLSTAYYYDWYCIEESTNNYRCKLYANTTEKTVLQVGTATAKIAIPLNDGELLDMSSTYCQGGEAVRLRSNNDISAIQIALIEDYNLYLDTIITVDTLYYTDTLISATDTIYSIREELDIDTTYSEVFGDIVLSSDNLDSVIIYESGEYSLDLIKFDEAINTAVQLILYYQDANSCPGDTSYTPVIHAIPQAYFESDTVCEDKPITLQQISPDAEWVTVENQNWDFGDGNYISNFSSGDSLIASGTHSGNTSGSYQQPSHKYSDPGKYEVFLSVMSDVGCVNYTSDSITIGMRPIPDFDFSGKLEGYPSTFTNKTFSESYDPVLQYTYSFKSPSDLIDSIIRTTAEDYDYLPKEHGVYTVQLDAITQNGCASSIDTLIPIYEVIVPNNETMFTENFTDSTPEYGWIHSGEYRKDEPSGWKYAPISGSFLDDDEHHDGYMWQTGTPTDSIDDEQSWLESPCFDIRDLSFPMISMDIFESFDAGREGAAMFYTIDDGLNWNRLGSNNTGGANWYNSVGIFSQPGDTIAYNEGSIGWSKDTNAWVTARHALDLVKMELTDDNWCVRFGVAFNGNTNHIARYEGVGIDNFLIGKRKRIIMIEEFINSDYDEAYPNNDGQTDITALDSFIDSVNSTETEVVDMRYHMQNYHYNDPLSLINTVDVGARAYSYGASEWGPMWVMDGVICTRSYEDVFDYSYEEKFMERSLIDPSWDIRNVSVENTGESLNIKATISKLSYSSDENLGEHDVKVRCAVVKKTHTKDGVTHRNVLVELLPNGVGNWVESLTYEDFKVGDTLSINETWTPNVSTSDSDFRIVIYVQGNLEYDEIDAVYFYDLDALDVPSTVNAISAEESSELHVYPNPVSTNMLTVEYTSSNFGDVNWSIFSVNGLAVKQGVLNPANEITELDLYELNTGMYLLQLIDSEGKVSTKRFTKIE